MSTLIQAIRALEGIAAAQPAVNTVIGNDVFEINATPDVRYGVFAWTQGQHREDLDAGFLVIALTLFYVDRLTADAANRLEVQSVGVQVIGNILRVAEEAGIFPVGEVRYNTFNQKFVDECAGVFASVDLQVPLDWLCPDDYVPPTPEPPDPPREIYVVTLMNESFAYILSGAHGDYVEIEPTAPYQMSQVLDLAEVARNEKKLTEGVDNIIAWNKALPAGWTQQGVADIYDGVDLNFTPRGGMLWAVGNEVDRLELSFAGGSYVAADQPWGSYQSEGIFAPRWNSSKEAEYAALGFRNTPRVVVVTIRDVFSSVAQVMFTMMRTTESLTINLGDVFVCHDVVGMFESNAMRELIINGPFRWDAIRTCHNMFDGCDNLEAIPYVTGWGRESQYNTIYPRWDGIRGSADCARMFRNCHALQSIGPVLNMNAISLNGCTVDGSGQSALSDTLFQCPELTDVRLKNVGNNSWQFNAVNTKTYIPKMDAASIDYLLNNVKDETGNGYSLRFASLHQAEVSAAAIANAQAKGWTVQFVD